MEKERIAIVFLGRSVNAALESLQEMKGYDRYKFYYSPESQETWEKIKEILDNPLLKVETTLLPANDYYESFITFLNIFLSSENDLRDKKRGKIFHINITGCSKEQLIGLVLALFVVYFRRREYLNRIKIFHKPLNSSLQQIPLPMMIMWVGTLFPKKRRKAPLTQKILLKAIAKGEVSLSRLAEKVGTSKPTILAMLKEFEENGLIKSRKKGKEKFYFMDKYQHQIFQMLNELEKRHHL